MEPVHVTDYFAVIPKVGLPGAVIPHPVNDRAFDGRLSADLSLVALMLSAATVVAMAVLNLSH
jgi:hypothetical protein